MHHVLAEIISEVRSQHPDSEDLLLNNRVRVQKSNTNFSEEKKQARSSKNETEQAGRNGKKGQARVHGQTGAELSKEMPKTMVG